MIIYSYIGYSTTNTLLDTSTMIARGSKVILIIINITFPKYPVA